MTRKNDTHGESRIERERPQNAMHPTPTDDRRSPVAALFADVDVDDIGGALTSSSPSSSSSSRVVRVHEDASALVRKLREELCARLDAEERRLEATHAGAKEELRQTCAARAKSANGSGGGGAVDGGA